jgi:hypothetical protein
LTDGFGDRDAAITLEIHIGSGSRIRTWDAPSLWDWSSGHLTRNKKTGCLFWYGLKAVAQPLSESGMRQMLESNQRVINDFAASILKLVLSTGIDPASPPWKGSVLATRRRQYKINRINFGFFE